MLRGDRRCAVGIAPPSWANRGEIPGVQLHYKTCAIVQLCNPRNLICVENTEIELGFYKRKALHTHVWAREKIAQHIRVCDGSVCAGVGEKERTPNRERRLGVLGMGVWVSSPR